MALSFFLISQTANQGYDTYDSAVVVAESPEAARQILPDTTEAGAIKLFWAPAEDVTAVLLGPVPENSLWSEGQTVCSSFNAG